MISEQYKAKLEELHREKPESFGKSSSKWAYQVMGICSAFQTDDVLDYGCGKAELNLHLPFPVKCYDPAMPKYSAWPDPADIVVCTDVMEHVEEDMIDKVIEHIHSLTKKAAFFQIATVPSLKTFPDGENLHISLHPQEWWMDKFEGWTVNAGPVPTALEKDHPDRGFKAGDVVGFCVILTP